MGVTIWRRPLPRTATREEMLADLDALRAEIKRTVMMNIIVIGTTLVGGLALMVIVAVA